MFIKTYYFLSAVGSVIQKLKQHGYGWSDICSALPFHRSVHSYVTMWVSCDSAVASTFFTMLHRSVLHRSVRHRTIPRRSVLNPFFTLENTYFAGNRPIQRDPSSLPLVSTDENLSRPNSVKTYRYFYKNYYLEIASSQHCDQKIDNMVMVAVTCVPPYRSAVASIIIWVAFDSPIRS